MPLESLCSAGGARYLLYTTALYLFNASFMGREHGGRLELGVLVALGAALWSALLWVAALLAGASIGTLGYCTHQAGFTVFLLLLCRVMYVHRTTQLTSWCLVLQLLYFHFDVSDPRSDPMTRVLHPVSFCAAFGISAGFFVAKNCCGARLPPDVDAAARARRPVALAVAAGVGFMHAAPCWFHAVSAALNSEHLRRVYAPTGPGPAFLPLAFNLGFPTVFLYGFVWESWVGRWGSIFEVYNCGQQERWRARARIIARALRLGTPEQLIKRQASVLGLGEEFVFSAVVKATGLVSMLAAAAALQSFLQL